MVQLMRDRNNGSDVFIDLGALSPTEVITVEPKCSTLFIDNAQLYDRTTLAPRALRKTFVVAAFSPGTRCKDALHVEMDKMHPSFSALLLTKKPSNFQVCLDFK